MKVKIQLMGWTRAAANMEMYCPYGYRTYLCIAENGIVCYRHTAVVDEHDAPIKDGVYELKDDDWKYDNPRWEQDCEEIEVA